MDFEDLLKNEWWCLYQFLAEKVSADDIVKANKSLFFLPNIPIRDKLLVARVTDKKRKFFVWFSETSKGFFKSLKTDGSLKRQTNFDSVDDAIDLVKEKFDIKLPSTKNTK